MATFIDNIVMDSSYIFGRINTRIKQLDYTRVLKRDTGIAFKLSRYSDSIPVRSKRFFPSLKLSQSGIHRLLGAVSAGVKRQGCETGH